MLFLLKRVVFANQTRLTILNSYIIIYYTRQQNLFTEVRNKLCAYLKSLS